MSADFRYMKCPRQTWFLVYTIPQDLRGHARFMTATGRPMDKIVESLNTKDPDKARENRDQRIAELGRLFRILRGGPNEDDLAAAAVEVFKKAVKEREKASAAFADDRSDEERREDYLYYLDEAIDWTACGEVNKYCEQIGITLESGTEPYRKIGIEFLKAQIAADFPG